MTAETVYTRMDQIRSDLLNPDQQRKLGTRIAEMSTAALELEMTGSPADVSNAIGQYQYLRGKIDAFKELLEDHSNAYQEAAEAPQ